MKKCMFKIKKLHKEQYRIIICFLLSLVLLCIAGGQLFAKYYAGQSNKGVATASSLYFSSNVLKTVTTDDTYPAIYNSNSWDGTVPCEIDVQIRNYQNQLLYNDEDLDIEYNITFELYGTSDDGTYEVKYNSTTSKITSEPVTFSGIKLKGGSLSSSNFSVFITRPTDQSGNANYRSSGIKVTATPVSPSYVKNAESLTLGGILYASMLSVQYKLEHNFDKVTSLSDFSGFPCTISYTPGEDNQAHRVKIRWKNCLEIDRFDPYYMQVKSDSSKCGTEIINDVSWNFMEITMQPYSTIQIVFYRADSFPADVNLAESVELDDLTKNSGGSGSE